MVRFIERLRRGFAGGSMLVKIIYVNIAVFLLIRIGAFAVGIWDGDPQSLIVRWVGLPSDPVCAVMSLWTVVTYMFVQYDLLHLLFNMLWLYWFGQYFLILGTQRQLLAVYVYGGVGGALLYLLAVPWLYGPVPAFLIGSSASVLAIVVASAWRMPDYRVGLLFLGDVALKWIAVAAVVISLLPLSGNNAGGGIAHLGGALTGAALAAALGRGRDLTRPFCRMMDMIVNLLSRPAARNRCRRHPGTRSSAGNDGLNDILDKIRRSGYASLTASERRKLFDFSKGK